MSNSDIFHNLAKDAGNKLRSYLLSISSGATGVFFYTLTGSSIDGLSALERNCVCIAFAFFIGTVLCCLYELNVDARRFYRAAKENEKPKQEQNWKEYEKLKASRERLTYGSYGFLFIALVATIVYIANRVYLY